MATNDLHVDRIEKLRSRESELVGRIEKVTGDRRREHGALDPDSEDQAVERENDEVLDGLDQIERSELATIRLALRRIDAGCFGICDDCGSDIDPLRLEVDPSAACYVRCAASREGERGPRE